MQTYAYGFPRLGKNREYKKIIEGFWEGRICEKELVSSLNAVEEERISFYKDSVDTFPLGEFTYYDNIFDNALIFGIYKFKGFNDYFSYARGEKSLELKKYFNTNYHYLVPFLGNNTKFSLAWNKPLFYFNTFFSFKDNPLFLVGPYTFLKLSRVTGNFSKIFEELCLVYEKLFQKLEKHKIHSLHLEEPAFCRDVPQKEVSLIVKNYKKIIPSQLKINLITYYESVDFLDSLYDLPFYSLGLDFIEGRENLAILKKFGFPRDKKMICGIVNGRSPLRSDILSCAKFLESIRRSCKLNEENVLVSNSCPLYHLPLTLENEKNINPQIKGKISFAQEKLYELKLIKMIREGKTSAFEWSRDLSKKRVRITREKFNTLSLKKKQFYERKKLQADLLKLPLFPVTTIGSFPQDKELREKRKGFRKGKVCLAKHDSFIRDKIFKLIEKEEEIGLNVLVHGEFERSDMVEFFAEKLKGFFTTDNGWVISYGTRVYRPPLIYDKIEKQGSLTLKEIFYAQSITSKPVKGIFTGPVTILAWSYNLRQDPLYRIAFELAKVLNKEARELTEKGIKIIQIDEPAIKEFAPLKEKKRSFYFSWAIRSFNLASKLPDSFQIHTHMCYSDFADIVAWIMRMNFDVITVEAAREKARVLNAFRKAKFNRAIGPGVWDIHSKYPAREENIRHILAESIRTFGARNVWVNPDCGLKTRNWPEVEISLRRMVRVARMYRKKYQKPLLSTSSTA